MSSYCPSTRLVTRNYGGNLHESAIAINAESLSDYVLSMDSPSGHNTIVVFRIPYAEQFPEPPAVKRMRRGE
jgi:hypothetical protein